MHLKSIYLRDFRNYTSLSVQFSPKTNVIYGENGQGKTNLLEAIYLLATGRSFRTLRLNELIRQGANAFLIEAEILKDDVTSTLRISFDGQTKKLEHNGTRYSSFHPLLGLLPSVLYSPLDAEFISGSPAVRRRFINLHLAQSDPNYLHSFTLYWQAMRQRNALLKRKVIESIECWEQQMAPAAIYVREKRFEMLRTLPPFLQQAMESLSPQAEPLELRFYPSYPEQADGYLQQLKQNRSREVQMGFTLTGPHRDDFILLMEGRSARLFASEGQKRTATFAIKLAQWHQLAQLTGETPLFGIDDFGLHLDDERKERLRTLLGGFGQIFLTTPQLLAGDFSEAHRILIHQGAIAESAFYTQTT